MASLVLSTAIFNKLLKNTLFSRKLFRPTLNCTEIIISSASKCIYETTLVYNEFELYYHLTSSLAIIDTYHPQSQSSIWLIGIMAISNLGLSHAYIVPLVRSSYKIYTKKVQVLNIY